jgi:hypothetical protein
LARVDREAAGRERSEDKAGLHDLAWLKSSCGAGDGDRCVEAAAGKDALYVRASKHTAGPVAGLTPEAWTEFIGCAARHTA